MPQADIWSYERSNNKAEKIIAKRLASLFLLYADDYGVN
jgi:hypothetical protein